MNRRGGRRRQQQQQGSAHHGSADLDAEFQRVLELSKQTYEEEERRRAEEKHLLAAQKWPWDEPMANRRLLSVMNWQPSFTHRGVGLGLKNLGNSCFMNATLQCLTYCPPVAQLLCESHHSRICKKTRRHGDRELFCALCEMENVVPSMLLGVATPKSAARNRWVEPRAMFRGIPKVNSLLAAGCQEDAHEYLQGLLDKMEEGYNTKQNNPITRLFEGGIKTDIVCGGCRTRRVVEEPFSVLSLDASKGDSLDECLTVLSHDELLSGEDKYFCAEVCGRKRLAKKRMMLSKLPAVLVLHLKRFGFDENLKTTKIGKFIEFPHTLDFGEEAHYIHPDDKERVARRDGDRSYELCAVLVHSGPHLGYGHYYSFVKAANHHWYRMNDAEVLRTTLQRVLKQQAYILVYKRTTHRALAMKLKAHMAQEKEQRQASAAKLQPAEVAATVPAAVEAHVAVSAAAAADSAEEEESEGKGDEEEKNSPKVSEDMITKDYFEANACNERVSEEAVRAQYVKVPGLSSVPEQVHDSADADACADAEAETTLTGTGSYENVIWPHQ